MVTVAALAVCLGAAQAAVAQQSRGASVGVSATVLGMARPDTVRVAVERSDRQPARVAGAPAAWFERPNRARPRLVVAYTGV